MQKLAKTLTIAAFASCACVMAQADDRNDKKNEDKWPTSIKVEPEYQCDTPLYALAVFGEEADRPMWMVLDKSAAEDKSYDQLYVDLNGNGDLTDEDERFSFVDDEGKKTKGIDLPDVVVSSGQKYTEFKVSLRDSKKGICMFKATWNEEIKFAGGYPELPSKGYMTFAKSQSEAPVVSFKGNMPFEFQPWLPKPLKIGSRTTVKLFMGYRGRNHSSFCSTMGHILPDEEIVLATLNYVDIDGKRKRVDSKLTERC